MSTNALYENYFPHGGFHILDPESPDSFSERITRDNEYDFVPTYPETLPDGSIVIAIIPGFKDKYGLDSSGHIRQWYSNRGEREETQSEEESPFYHLYQYDGARMTMENLGDSHRTEQSRDPRHWACREYSDSADPEDWGEMLKHFKRVRMALFVTICQWVQSCKSQKTLNKGYWKFRHRVDQMYKDKYKPCFRWLTNSQVRVIFALFRARRENLRAG